MYEGSCNCGRGNKAAFVCFEWDCGDHKQTLFCFDCVVFDSRHKSHKKTSIKDELEKFFKCARDIIENAKISRINFEENKFEGLLMYLRETDNYL